MSKVSTIMIENNPVHDNLSTRLAHILFKLNQGEKIDPRQLAHEFSVDVRTIQRDLNVRLAALPIYKNNGFYQLEAAYLGRIDTHRLREFAQFSGIKGLFPRLDGNFVKHFVQQQEQLTIQVQGSSYENFDERLTSVFFELDRAILGHQHLTFTYTKRDHEQKDYLVEPYRLKNHDGLWYLSAVHQGTLKSFALSRMSTLTTQSTIFTPNVDIQQQLDKDDSIWLGEKQSVILEVTGKARQYFKARPLVPQQQLLSETDNTLILSTQIRHADQLLPIVQYWIPFVRIIEPKEMQAALVVQLNEYLKNF
jgi:predicted DNA-binding transcriptional regulator YafY